MFRALCARARFYVQRFDRVVWLLAGGVFVESIGRFLVDPYLTLFLVTRGVDLGAVGVVLAAAPLAAVFIALVGGSLSDRWGRRPVQVLGIVTSGLVLLGFGLVGTSAVALTILNFLNGMSRALYRPAITAAVADVTPADRRAEAFGLHRVMLNIGAAVGPALGLALFHWRPTLGFWVAGTANLVLGLYFVSAVPETRPPEVRMAPAQRAAARNRMVEWQQWREVARDGLLWLWLLGGALGWGIYRLIDTFLPVHLETQRVPPWVYGVMLPLNALICVVTQLPINYAAVGPRFVPEIAPVHLRGRYMGAAELANLGHVVMPLVGASVMSGWGGNVMFFGAAVLGIISGAICVVADNWRLARPLRSRPAQAMAD